MSPLHIKNAINYVHLWYTEEKIVSQITFLSFFLQLKNLAEYTNIKLARFNCQQMFSSIHGTNTIIAITFVFVLCPQENLE
jgi:hypothetical protein